MNGRLGGNKGLNYDATAKNLNVRNDEDGGTMYLQVKNGRIYFNQYGGGNVAYVEVPSGNASFNGNVTAANNVRARETGWFAISALQEVLKDNPLGVMPKGITVFCASPTDQSEVTVAGPTVAHWHDWGGSDYGAFLRVTATQIRVRAGNYVGWHSGTWQTSGYYNIVFWA